jgi:hypothetical protein
LLIPRNKLILADTSNKLILADTRNKLIPGIKLILADT